MTTPLTAPTDRRRFLGRMGMTLAAGLGLAAVGSIGSAEAAPRTDAEPTTRAGSDSVNACAIYCYRTSEPCNSCGSGIHRYRCSGPCGTYYACYRHSCASYCLSPNAC